MARIAAVVLTLFAFTAVAAPAADAAPRKCKKGYVLKTVRKKGKRVKVCKKRKKPVTKEPATQTDPTTQHPNPDPTGDPGTQPQPTDGANQTPPSQTTRDDGAGRQAMGAAGDLLLERAEFGSSGQTASYYRIWMLQDGSFKYVEVSWNSVGGETCSKVQTGAWAFKEGYTFAAEGGGTIVKVTITFANGQSGDDVVAFSNANPDAVYVGVQGVRFDRNPYLANNC
jgi:hypothetical protein